MSGWEILRYKPDGTLDTVLGTQGHLNLAAAVQVMGAPTTTGWLYVLEAVPYSVSGISNNGTDASSYLEVHRYSASTGAMDSGFKVNLGHSLYDYGSNLQVRRGVYGDDSIYVMQTSYYTPGSSNSSTFPGVLVQRYTPSGALDSQYSVRIPNTDLQHIRSVSGIGVLVETTVYDGPATQLTGLQRYKTDGTLDQQFGEGGTLVIPAGSQYALVPAGLEIVNAQGQVTLYGPEGHPVSTGTVPGLTFNAATKTFSIDTSDAAYNTLTAGQTKTISTHYTVTDQNGTWDEGEVRITVTGDRIYEGASAKGTLNSAGLDQVFIRDTSADNVVDVNMTQGLRAVGTDSLGRTYVLNWNEVYESSSSGTYPAGSTAGTGFVQVHRFLSTGALDTTYG